MPQATRAILAITVCLAAAGCGGSPSAPSPAPSNPYTVTINASGIVTPKELTVPPGTRVLFVNSHSRAHAIASNPHPDHTDCTEINQVGLLNPGASRETGNLVAVRTCGFHDHDDFANANLQGRIVVR